MDWDLLGSLYIIPFLVEQKIEACCFGLVPPFCALIPAALSLVSPDQPPSYLPSQVLGPWILILIDPQDIGCLFLPC